MKKIVDGVVMDMTPDEIAEIESAVDNQPEPEPTPEERIANVEQRTDALESTTDDMILLMADIIGG